MTPSRSTVTVERRSLDRLGSIHVLITIGAGGRVHPGRNFQGPACDSSRAAPEESRGGPMGFPLLLLTTTGKKSGQRRQTLLIHLRER